MNIWTILLAILVLGILIFVHELGHFITAKWAGIKINEFAMGMGPTLWSFKRGETKYSVRLFPVGGFVAMEGENDESADKRAFCNVSVWKRMIVSVAGAAINIFLGLILLGILTSRQPLIGTTQIVGFYENSVSNSQLQTGDEILKVNGSRVRTYNDIQYEFMRDRDGAIDLLVSRSGEEISLSVQFQMNKMEDDTEFIYFDMKILGVKPTFWSGSKYTVNWTFSVIKMVWGSLIDLLTGRFGVTQISGPVGVAEAIGKASSIGIESFLYIVSIITVNFGVFNLLPIPALDGGRLLFLLAEAVRRKPLNPKYEGAVTAAGFILLIGVMIFASANDIFKIFMR